MESQRIAIRRGENSVRLAHIKEAYDSETLAPNHDLIRGFATKNAGLLSGYKDIPVEYYAQLWQKNKSGNKDDVASATETSVEPAGPAASTLPAKKPNWNSTESQFKSKQTRAKNRSAAVKVLNVTLAKEDMRRDGAQSSLIERFEDLKKRLP